MNDKPPPNNGTIELLAKLSRHLSKEDMELLVKLINDVKNDTGYGDVKIIIIDKRVETLKAERSYGRRGDEPKSNKNG